MGCRSSKSADAGTISRWRSTGIVALRDAKLKAFPFILRVVFLEANSHSSAVTVEIPMEINKLTNLQRLILADNIIERLPMNLGLLQSLKVATFDGNRITNLPDELGQLVKLERLSVSANLLTSLPDTIGSLRSLVLLNVSNNKLKFLPESIGSCCSLEELQANDAFKFIKRMQGLAEHSPTWQSHNYGPISTIIAADCEEFAQAFLQFFMELLTSTNWAMHL
ncbi:hypothetical protein KY290_018812 [Solanum tuberosum]|uniref:Disease resistance R13L4/SHOC-2-like LRR domain-containing protein n=1 Tax=Solanum tuberosum TaxID=4113 RepID=A0ABQ7VFC8_SOLTU|nr:hypothetical protein KY290_018812 [Solanum tuberosum]